ncbi:hypothetical protein K435DRAFT_646222 [Dendrothele bispora CBS 962.96]|uniref:Adipose-regulatory protein n=1 Tax=Dendrothele bispora (strain CBS 962.96) TaxID=1314807 RepID=A0A4S8MSH6_DENBC|nr:hypothetical protein K435DRAFT_646222 [Dendrothele bispora CBS 962.96]
MDPSNPPPEQKQNARFYDAPLNSLRDFVSRSFASLAPHLLPLVFFCLLIPVIINTSLFAGYIVWRNVAVGWEAPLYLQYGDSLTPYARTSLPPLVSRQPYDIILHLEIPTSESNLALGNFMNNVVLVTTSNKTVASVRRSAILLPAESSWFFGTPGVVTVDVPMLSAFVPGTTSLDAEIQIGRKDNWKGLGNGEQREVSIVYASLKGVVAHKGIRGLMTRFPLTLAVLSAATFFAILTLISGACLLPSIMSRSPTGNTSTTEVKATQSLPIEDSKEVVPTKGEEEERSRRRRRRNRKRDHSQEVR